MIEILPSVLPITIIRSDKFNHLVIHLKWLLNTILFEDNDIYIL